MKKYGNNLTCFLFYGSILSSVLTIVQLNKKHSGWLFSLHNYDQEVYKTTFILLVSIIVFFVTVLYKNLVLDKKKHD